jgi:predicted dehydrogenase
MTPEQKAIGKGNFNRAVGKLAEADGQREGLTRRRFMQGMVAAGAAAPVAAAAYFGYSNERFRNRPVKAGIIGCGDEGGVLVGEHNKEYLEFIGYSDLRPSNRQRIFTGEPTGPRKGFNRIYGSQAERNIRRYDNYRELLANPDIKMVVIALPLHLHAPVAIDAMRAGKHVLCEKLMAWNIRQCKDMIRVSRETDKLLAIGHQRHYSMLYAHAVEVLNSGVLGEVRHIRALWHRNNARPRLRDGHPIPDPENPGQVLYIDGWRPEIKPEDRAALESDIRQLGYKDMKELVRWRLFHRTGGGLMAELGSHQLDACSIFLSHGDLDHPVHPVAITAVGGKYFYDDDRQTEDHVFCTYEFPGPNYHPKQRPGDPMRRHPDDVIVVTYSSISTNSFEKYGECVMGSKGTLVVEEEQNVMLWGTAGRSTEVTVTTAGGGRPALEASSSTAPEERRATARGESALGYGPVSRGYREEMEHFAYCIQMRDEGMEADRRRLVPRCGGERAMGDAIMALTANKAMRLQQRIVFNPDWYNPDSPAVPDDEPAVDLDNNPVRLT